jgi:hypothetical protein
MSRAATRRPQSRFGEEPNASAMRIISGPAIEGDPAEHRARDAGAAEFATPDIPRGAQRLRRLVEAETQAGP